MNKDELELSNRDLTLFAFGSAIDKKYILMGYKHRKAIITLLSRKYRDRGILDYDWDGNFWGPVSEEYEENLAVYNFQKIYFSTLDFKNFEKTKGKEPIHHKSIFWPRGLSWYFDIYDTVKDSSDKEIYKDFLVDSFVYSNLDTPILVNHSLYNGYKDEGKINIDKVWKYDTAFDVPNEKEKDFLETIFKKKRIVVERSNPFQLTISDETIDESFEYMDPSKKSLDEAMKWSKEKLKCNMGSLPIALALTEKFIPNPKEVIEKLDDLSDEISDKELQANYKKEIKEIKDRVVDKKITLNFLNDKAVLDSEDIKKPYSYRYIWHILQPLELICYFRSNGKIEW